MCIGKNQNRWEKNSKKLKEDKYVSYTWVIYVLIKLNLNLLNNW